MYVYSLLLHYNMLGNTPWKNRTNNEEYTIQRHWQHWENKKQNGDKQKIKQNKPQHINQKDKQQTPQITWGESGCS